MSNTNLLFTLALQNASNIGDITAKKLIAHCGSAEEVLNEKKQTLLKIDGIGTYAIRDLHKDILLEKAIKELEFIKENNLVSHYFMDSDYPEKLKHCIDGPILLFQKGNINIKNQHIISIVGARKITTQGIANCEAIVERLAPYNPIIVSGFAYGTDISAQKTAMKHNLQTIGCLAHGFNQIYPKAHKRYVADIENMEGFLLIFGVLMSLIVIIF